MLVLYKGYSWEGASVGLGCDESTIRKYFNTLVEKGVIGSVYDVIKKQYGKGKRFSTLYVDSTSLMNKNESVLAEYFYKLKSKKSIKISALVDDNKIPQSFVITRGAESDVKAIPDLIDGLCPDLLRKNVTVCGDKGYITQDSQYIYNNNNKKWRKVKNPNSRKFVNRSGVKLTVIADKKRNQKGKNTKFEKRKLKKRYKVENCFARNKGSFKRIEPVYDRKTANTEAFYQLAICHMSLDIILIT